MGINSPVGILNSGEGESHIVDLVGGRGANDQVRLLDQREDGTI